MRLAKACTNCRAGKRRCDRNIAGACTQCIQRDLQCSNSSTALLTGDAPSPTALGTLPNPILTGYSDSEVLYLVDLYFKFIHDKAHSLFHEPSFKSSVANGTASRQVLLSMIGLSARYAKDPDIVSHGSIYAVEAKKVFKDDFENSSLENIQAAILIGSTCLGSSDPNATSLYFVLANRMAQILNIGAINDTDDGVTREIKTRIWWTIFIIDTWASCGSDLPRQFKLEPKKPRVPMDEATFFHMRVGDPDVTPSEWKSGLWGHMVEPVQIYFQIQDLHKYLTETGDWDENRIEEAVQTLDLELIAFEQNLDPEMRYSLGNLAAYISKGLGRAFIAFHLGYYHYHTLLFYQYLDHRRHPTRNGRIYAERCKMNAKMVCDILKASREFEGAEAVYDIVGHLAVVSSSVLVHTYLFGDTDELIDTKRRLQSNLESLVQLRSYWTSVEVMINRLVIFQNNCIWSVTKNTHRFDRWMVKFLLQHAVALEEKVEEDGVVQQCIDTDIIAESEYLQRSKVTESIIHSIQNTKHNF